MTFFVYVASYCRKMSRNKRKIDPYAIIDFESLLTTVVY